MDWAIAPLLKDLPDPNVLPTFEITRPDQTVLLMRYFENPFPTSITGIATDPLEPEAWVIKNGRSTGWTFGVVNECKSYHFHWQAKGETTKSLAIIGNRGPFSDYGDSGSVVLNSEEEVAALLFAAECPSDPDTNRLPFKQAFYGLTFAVEITVTMRVIQKKTKMKDIKLLTPAPAPSPK